MAGCRHPRESRTSLNAWWDRCKCGKEIKKRRSTVRHGTAGGYDKHFRERERSWSWPACGPCQEAHRVYRSSLNQKESLRVKNLKRGKARVKAMSRLREMYPADFAKLYAEELGIINEDDAVASVARLQAEAASILSSLYPSAVRYPEAVLRHSVADRSATVAERAAWYRIQELRKRVRELEGR